ncbi:hypothetical protein SEVIR_8G250816v4 [Setaria viridis]
MFDLNLPECTTAGRRSSPELLTAGSLSSGGRSWAGGAASRWWASAPAAEAHEQVVVGTPRRRLASGRTLWRRVLTRGWSGDSREAGRSGSGGGWQLRPDPSSVPPLQRWSHMPRPTRCSEGRVR